MMKKILAFLLTAVIATTLVSCDLGGKDTTSDDLNSKTAKQATFKTALEAYQAAYQNFGEAYTSKAMKSVISGTSKFTIGGVAQEMKMSGSYCISAEENMKMSMEMKITTGGMEVPTSSYLANGMLYTNLLGSTVKMPIDENTLATMKGSSSMVDLSAAGIVVQNQKINPLEGGGSEISFDVDTSTLNDSVTKSLNSAFSGALNGSVGVKYNKLSMKLVIDENSIPKKLSMLASLATNTDDGTGKMVESVIDMDLTMNFELLPDGYEITPPAGIDLENAKAYDAISLLEGASGLEGITG